jgi:nitrate reductase gamma subunit
MDSLLQFAEGPIFRLALAIMLLGLVRHLLVLFIGMGHALYKAAVPVPPFGVPFSKLLKITVKWMLPYSHLKNRMAYSIVSLIFHVGLLLVPLLLFAHIQLWQKGFGFGWPALPNIWADVMTVAVVVTAVTLFVMRVADRDSRFLSRPQDYWLLWLLALPFISGFLAAHPGMNPLSYTAMRLLHILSGELVLILMPFTKIIHCVFYPMVHFASNYAWRLAPDAGENVWKTLGKEGNV